MRHDRKEFYAWVRRHKIGPGMNDTWRAERSKASVAKEFYDEAKGSATIKKIVGEDNIDSGSNLMSDGLYSGFDGTVGPGWVPILDSLANDLKAMGWDGGLQQVKEKFGTLRFYIRYSEGLDHQKAEERIDQAEEESSHVCELCGKGGTLRRDGWWRTLCDSCEEERNRGKA